MLGALWVSEEQNDEEKHEVVCIDCSVIISAVGVVTKRVGCSSFCSKPPNFLSNSIPSKIEASDTDTLGK